MRANLALSIMWTLRPDLSYSYQKGAWLISIGSARSETCMCVYRVYTYTTGPEYGCFCWTTSCMSFIIELVSVLMNTGPTLQKHSYMPCSCGRSLVFDESSDRQWRATAQDKAHRRTPHVFGPVLLLGLQKGGNIPEMFKTFKDFLEYSKGFLESFWKFFTPLQPKLLLLTKTIELK